MRRLRSFLSAICVAAVIPAVAQVSGDIGKDRMMLFGVVTEDKGGADMRNVCVRLYTDSVAGDSVFTDAMGKYQLFIPLKGVHRLVYSMDGYHRKVVQVDASGEMDEAARKQEWNMRVDISLVQATLALPDELLDTPVGKAEWQPEMREFKWDQPYTERYKLRYKQAVKAAGRK
ncbi:MAG: hypothetical protein KF797_01175 [Flavobacteriales bacterium]|nr:hypothetical protein [Flavobacteriales bacterium]